MLNFSVRKYLIILNLLFIYVFFNMNTSVARDMYPGQVVYGQIGKFGLGTTIKLPEGEWVVAGTASKNGTIRPEEIILMQIEDKKIKAILFIRYARDIGLTQGWDAVTGWRPEETYKNNTCDDYDDQKSNYHYEKINKKSQQLIVNGACMAVYVDNDIYNVSELSLDNSIQETYDMAEQFVKNNNLEYPNALIFIDNTYFSKKNYVQTYFAINPEFKGIKSSSQVFFTNSDWHKYNIDSYPDKKRLMDESIFIGQQVFTDNIKKFDKGKALDFYGYNALF